MALRLLPNPPPALMDLGRRAGRAYQRSGLQSIVRHTPLGRLLPGPLGSMEALLTSLPDKALLDSVPEVVPPEGPRRRRVVFFWNCVMNVMLPEASQAAIRVLARAGCEVVVPRDLGCCGALHFDQGDAAMGRRLARRNVDRLIALNADAIVTDAAACGAQTKEYAELMEHEPDYVDKARDVSARVRDITQILAELVPDGPSLGPVPERVTYHEACHLAHGQKITKPPRDLLRLIPELEFVELPESNWCCGSAGIYNVSHAATADELLDRKLDHLERTRARYVVTTNPGCLVQLMKGVRERGLEVQVMHLVELLDRSYAAAAAPAGAAPARQ
ncbi:MAG TPA: heterodisulfide reductase-related iron-sulfur binding cluster [Dehalococcoidia bacterium]|nr:heterodisulfide reductase-related iron-sulfur binding cluster [Dehalococcoidia bacterium]